MVGLVIILLLVAGAGVTYVHLLKTGRIKYNQYDRRRQGMLRAGDLAPDLLLTTFQGEPLRLSSLWKNKPLVLVFASCT